MKHRAKKAAPGRTGWTTALVLCLVVLTCQAGEVERRINQALEENAPGKARVGIEVVRIADGRVIYSKNSTESFMPASNQKLVTAAGAMLLLKPDYEFETVLWGSGSRDTSGGLRGDLKITGGGDPTIGSPEFAARYPEHRDPFRVWASRLAATGLRRITGQVVVDGGFFDHLHVHPEWPEEQLWRTYCAPVSALAFQNNCVQVSVKPGPDAGEPAKVEFSPDVPGLNLRNSCRTHPERHAIWFDRDPSSDVIQVGGHVLGGSVGYAGYVTVPAPSLFAARAFALQLRRAGVYLGRPFCRLNRDADEKSWYRIDSHRTPIKPVLSVMMTESQNFYAEQIVKTIGAENRGEGSWEEGLGEISAALREVEVDLRGVELADGSGMSRGNRLTPRAVCRLLLRMDEQFGAEFRELLPRPGEGTLHNRLTSSRYRSRVRAKTGYLHSVSALSGYVRTVDQEAMAFSIMINESDVGNSRMGRLEDAIVRVLV
ncbi:MAG: D-alanyl-D-alanine carboxypeptidase/D-alanyl-D-alanine-endopeptidase, partial [Candidatus Brocadiia bacterium]